MVALEKLDERRFNVSASIKDHREDIECAHTQRTQHKRVRERERDVFMRAYCVCREGSRGKKGAKGEPKKGGTLGRKMGIKEKLYDFRELCRHAEWGENLLPLLRARLFCSVVV